MACMDESRPWAPSLSLVQRRAVAARFHVIAMSHSRTLFAFVPCLGLLLACDLGGTPSKIPEPTDEPSEPSVDEGLLIDDFEDGDLNAEIGVRWHFYADEDVGGSSVVTTESDQRVLSPGYESEHALGFEFSLDRGDYEWEPFTGTGFAVPGSVQASEYEGLSYVFKGAAHIVRFETSNIKDYDFT